VDKPVWFSTSSDHFCRSSKIWWNSFKRGNLLKKLLLALPVCVQYAAVMLASSGRCAAITFQFAMTNVFCSFLFSKSFPWFLFVVFSNATLCNWEVQALTGKVRYSVMTTILLFPWLTLFFILIFHDCWGWLLFNLYLTLWHDPGCSGAVWLLFSWRGNNNNQLVWQRQHTTAPQCAVASVFFLTSHDGVHHHLFLGLQCCCWFFRRLFWDICFYFYWQHQPIFCFDTLLIDFSRNPMFCRGN